MPLRQSCVVRHCGTKILGESGRSMARGSNLVPRFCRWLSDRAFARVCMFCTHLSGATAVKFPPVIDEHMYPYVIEPYRLLGGGNNEL
jgi:hypothetical protein